jgi:hypothetical protein
MAVYDPRGGGNIHIDVALTNVSVGYQNNALVGDRLFPSVPVVKQSNKYYIFGRETWSVHLDIRAPGTQANEIPGYQVSTDTYFANEHALQIPVTDEERQNADAPFDPDRDGAELVTEKVLLGREVAIKTLVTTAANYPAGGTLTRTGTAQWNDYVNSNPIGDLRDGIRWVNSQIFRNPNVLVLPYQVMSQLEDHPDFIERIKYSERGIMTSEIIAAVLGIETVIIPSSGQNTANPGQAVSLSYVWGKDVLLAYVPPRAGLRIPAFGYEYTWNYPGGQNQVVDRWRENPRKSDLIRMQRRYDLKLPAQDANGKTIAAYLIKTAVA